VAAVIVTIMLIPQSLAYALLAGLPPKWASTPRSLPIVLYAIFGTSRALAVGPVAVVSLMTAAAVGTSPSRVRRNYCRRDHAGLPVGRVPDGHGVCSGWAFSPTSSRHPVIAGFITASGILIAASQLKHILGIRRRPQPAELARCRWFEHLGEINLDHACHRVAPRPSCSGCARG
jgi:SulP family sulfate permease